MKSNMMHQKALRDEPALTAPPTLRKGDRVGVMCPASKIPEDVASEGCRILESWGLEVVEGETLNGHFHNFSATDEVRLQELQGMLDDRTLKAIIFGRGGYGMLRLLDRLDWTMFRQHPKWVCGYSDITALHLHISARCGFQTLHSVMAGGINNENKEDKYVRSLRHSLFGEKQHYYFDAGALNRKGDAQGLLVGGNLSLLSALCGSRSVPQMKGKLLFIEDIGEYKYLLDRMMLTLKRAGWLDELAGFVVGGFTNSHDTEEPFGQSEYELIYDKVKEYDYPVAFGFPVGHQKENYALKEGGRYRLLVADECQLKEL